MDLIIYLAGWRTSDGFRLTALGCLNCNIVRRLIYCFSMADRCSNGIVVGVLH